jgi:hypothetical protein
MRVVHDWCESFVTARQGPLRMDAPRSPKVFLADWLGRFNDGAARQAFTKFRKESR